MGGIEGADHRAESLRALSLSLTAEEINAIDEAVATGTILDGLART